MALAFKAYPQQGSCEEQDKCGSMTLGHSSAPKWGVGAGAPEFMGHRQEVGTLFSLKSPGDVDALPTSPFPCPPENDCPHKGSAMWPAALKLQTIRNFVVSILLTLCRKLAE